MLSSPKHVILIYCGWVNTDRYEITAEKVLIKLCEIFILHEF